MCFFKRSGIGILSYFLGDGAESGILTTLGARYGPRWHLGPTATPTAPRQRSMDLRDQPAGQLARGTTQTPHACLCQQTHCRSIWNLLAGRKIEKS